ncbi:integrase core domain-containing protein [Burkholderia ubonensis]|uniref:integrase core domain-containing protein n=1 Tax=Burkholderia ubonensis TaxID=101571 RepID=UPI001E31CC26|nr:integrase core domain-containing protein [Burkholderia ubonensis]
MFVEREWRGIKYEEVYLNAYEPVSHTRRSIDEYIELHNRKRPHSSLADQTPERHSWRRCLRSNWQHDCLGLSI